jgi:hypothetical protein
MYEGPAPGGLRAEAWRDMRASFLAGGLFATIEDARQYLKACDDALAAFPQHEEVVIWLDHRLSDQLILIKVLDWFSRQDLGAVKLSLICAGNYPGMDNFVGLGQLTADQLASLIETRSRVTDEQLRLAQAGWGAFTSPDPTAIERFIATGPSALSFLATAFRRHLEQFPSVDGGLSRTERQALSILNDRGSLPAPGLFVAVQRLEEQIFMGHEAFNRMMAELSTVRHPLLTISDSPEHGLGGVTITQTGRSVLESRGDHVELNGIDRWVGGVHLKGNKAAWRWDRSSERLVT